MKWSATFCSVVVPVCTQMIASPMSEVESIPESVRTAKPWPV